MLGRNLEITIYVIKECPENPWAVIAKDPERQAATFMKTYRHVEIRIPIRTQIVDSIVEHRGRYVLFGMGIVEEHPTDHLRCIIKSLGMPSRW